MIKLYHILPASDPMGGSRNAAKVSIALRELGEEFEIVDLSRERDLRPTDVPYRKINPNGVTPAIEDGDLVLWESSAILRYLADTRGSLLAKDLRGQAMAQQWLSWEASTFQPAFMAVYAAVSGNSGSKSKNAALDHYLGKLLILDEALDRGRGFVADEYSIADIALGMIVPIGFHLGIDLKDYSNIIRWLETLAARPAWGKELSFNNDMGVGHEQGYLSVHSIKEKL